MECLSSEMVIEEVGAKPVLRSIPDLAKFAFKSGICGWLLINIRREIRQNIARLEWKTGERLTRYSVFENVEVCMLSKFLHTALFHACWLSYIENQFGFVTFLVDF